MRLQQVGQTGLLALILAAPMALSGCGTANRTITTAPTFPYAGTFSGPFSFEGTTASFPSQTGTLSVTISPTGALTGSGDDVTLDQTITSTGTVTQSGNLTATLTLSAGTATLNGPVSIASNGHLIGTFAETFGTTPVGTLTVDLTKQ